MSKHWFVPYNDDDYHGPQLELTCGKHDKKGKFRPKNIKLTSIARLNKFENRRDQREPYIEAMRRKDPAWTIEAAEQRWAAASKSYFDTVREIRIETRLDAARKRITANTLQLALAA